MTNVVNNTQNISPLATPASATTYAVTTSTRSNPSNITRVASRGGGGGGSGANGSQACAACKYQRRRCASVCPLAPYFPAERQKDFLNAHKLFGVSNILKVLKNVPPFQKDNAMKALIFEANIRADDPVGGSHRVIQNLHRQINLYQAQLQLVYHQIVRVQEAAIQEQQNFNTMASVRGTNSTLNFDMLPLHDLHGFDRSNSISLGEAGSSSQIVKGKGVERFSSAEEFEAKTMMTHSDGKQPLVESEHIKPYFGSIHNFKGKGVTTELRFVS
ncbi:LOB domain-containing protein 6-like [Nicotiana tabacum]|uniref:LOB domain-containing protein 6-like n=1 Tax=Nicotiana tabacum TaxID=4097 RepID=UPI003F4E9DD5